MRGCGAKPAHPQSGDHSVQPRGRRHQLHTELLHRLQLACKTRSQPVDALVCDFACANVRSRLARYVADGPPIVMPWLPAVPMVGLLASLPLKLPVPGDWKAQLSYSAYDARACLVHCLQRVCFGITVYAASSL